MAMLPFLIGMVADERLEQGECTTPFGPTTATRITANTSKVTSSSGTRYRTQSRAKRQDRQGQIA